MKILQISPGGVRIPPDRAGGPEGHIFSMSKQLSSPKKIEVIGCETEQI